jgi:vesicle transport protein SEC22
MQTTSSNLSNQSKKYLKDTKKLHWQALYQTYGPPVIVVSIVLIVFYIRMFWW